MQSIPEFTATNIISPLRLSCYCSSLLKFTIADRHRKPSKKQMLLSTPQLLVSSRRLTDQTLIYFELPAMFYVTTTELIIACWNRNLFSSQRNSSSETATHYSCRPLTCNFGCLGTLASSVAHTRHSPAASRINSCVRGCHYCCLSCSAVHSLLANSTNRQ